MQGPYIAQMRKTISSHLSKIFGRDVDKNLLKIESFEKNKWGYINIDENYETSQKNVFACGDLAGEKATVAWAASSGIKACESIENRLK